MFKRHIITISCLPLAVLVQSLGAQVSVQVSPDNGSHPDPIHRLTNTTGNTVEFTITNNGTVDTRYSITCSGTGPITSVTCIPTNPLIAAGDFRIVTATFSTTYAGSGSVQLSVVSTTPTGASGAGKWDETVVNPAVSVTPDGTSIVKALNLSGTTQVYTISNLASAATTYTLTASCSGTGVSGCSVSPSSVCRRPRSPRRPASIRRRTATPSRQRQRRSATRREVRSRPR